MKLSKLPLKFCFETWSWGVFHSEVFDISCPLLVLLCFLTLLPFLLVCVWFLSNAGGRHRLLPTSPSLYLQIATCKHYTVTSFFLCLCAFFSSTCLQALVFILPLTTWLFSLHHCLSFCPHLGILMASCPLELVPMVCILPVKQRASWILFRVLSCLFVFPHISTNNLTFQLLSVSSSTAFLHAFMFQPLKPLPPAYTWFCYLCLCFYSVGV